MWSLAFIWTYSSIISGWNFGACFAFTEKREEDYMNIFFDCLWFGLWCLLCFHRKKGGGWGGATCHGYCSCFDLVSWLIYGPHLFQYFGLMICGWIFGALFSQRRKRIFSCWNSKISFFTLLHTRTTPLFQCLNKLMDQVEVVVGGFQKEYLSWNSKNHFLYYQISFLSTTFSSSTPVHLILFINALLFYCISKLAQRGSQCTCTGVGSPGLQVEPFCWN